MIRFADDFLLMFSNIEDALRVLKVLPKRFGKFGLALHSEKTKLIDVDDRKRSGPKAFDFLGFTHYIWKSRKGRWVLLRKTSSKKLRLAIRRTGEWIKFSRHRPIKELIDLNFMMNHSFHSYPKDRHTPEDARQAEYSDFEIIEGMEITYYFERRKPRLRLIQLKDDCKRWKGGGLLF